MSTKSQKPLESALLAGGRQPWGAGMPSSSCPLTVASRSQTNSDQLLFRLAPAQIIFKTQAAKFQALGPAKFTVPLCSH